MKENNFEKVAPMELELPTVGVVIVHHREGPWLKMAVDSIINQVYPGVQIKVSIVDNMNNENSIGACFNYGTKLLEDCEWIFYLGDDDKVSREYILSLMLRLMETSIMNPTYEFACVSSHTTLFTNEPGKPVRQEISSKVPTGIWKRSYVLENPFNEILKNCVDSEMFARLRKSNHQAVLASHQYGYFYRQHDDNVSGNKFDKGDFDKERPKSFKYLGPEGIMGTTDAKG